MQNYYMILIKKEFVQEARIVPMKEYLEDTGEWCDCSSPLALAIYKENSKYDAIKRTIQEYPLLSEEVLIAVEVTEQAYLDFIY